MRQIPEYTTIQTLLNSVCIVAYSGICLIVVMASRLAEYIKRKRTKSKSHYTLSEQLGNVDLPVRVKVISGHPSLDKYSITYDTQLDLYSCKSVKMSIVNDVVRSNQYLLPLTAKVKITPFYNPEDKIGIALAGYHYDSIQQLYDSNPRPTVVYVVSGYLHEDRQSSMDADDIYVIKECVMIDNQRVMICEEIISSEMKIFPIDLKCHLTTKPSKLSFRPSVFFNHHNLFASKVIITGIDQSILLSDDDDGVFLTVTQLSPIYSYTCMIRPVNQPYDCNTNITVEICDDVPIDIEIISLDQSATNLLRFEAESLQWTEDDSPVIIINEVKFRYNEIQMMFLNSSNKVRNTLIPRPSQATGHGTVVKEGLKTLIIIFRYCIFIIIRINSYINPAKTV